MIKRISRRKIVTLIITFAISNILCVREYTFLTDKVSGEIKLAVIADLHNYSYGESQSELVDKIAEEKADAVLFAGDLIDDVTKEDNAIVLMKALSLLYPCYYVSGNHEIWTGEGDRIYQLVEQCGVKVLHGDCAELTIGSDTINICGITYLSADDPLITKQLDSAIEKANNDNYTVLLVHSPDNIEKTYLKYNFDLVLCGHTHGGIIHLPFLNGIYSHGQGLFPKYAGGQYNFENGTSMVISRGLSRSHPRVFTNPELVFITIAGKES